MNLPAPYYDQDGITLYCGDRRNVLSPLSDKCPEGPVVTLTTHEAAVAAWNGMKKAVK